MSTSQNFTKIKDGTLVPRPYDQLTFVQQQYVDYKALGGVITTDEGVHNMSITELAARLGVSRNAVYDSVKYVPNFYDLVAQRRKELSGQGRLDTMHKLWYINAMKFKNWSVTEAWFRNFDPEYKEARQKVEHDVGDGFLEAMNLARQRARQIENVQEAEVIDAPNPDN